MLISVQTLGSCGDEILAMTMIVKFWGDVEDVLLSISECFWRLGLSGSVTGSRHVRSDGLLYALLQTVRERFEGCHKPNLGKSTS